MLFYHDVVTVSNYLTYYLISGQNKNKFMLGYFMWRVMTGQSSTVEYLMQIPGM